MSERSLTDLEIEQSLRRTLRAVHYLIMRADESGREQLSADLEQILVQIARVLIRFFDARLELLKPPLQPPAGEEGQNPPF